MPSPKSHDVAFRFACYPRRRYRQSSPRAQPLRTLSCACELAQHVKGAEANVLVWYASFCRNMYVYFPTRRSFLVVAVRVCCTSLSLVLVFFFTPFSCYYLSIRSFFVLVRHAPTNQKMRASLVAAATLLASAYGTEDAASADAAARKVLPLPPRRCVLAVHRSVVSAELDGARAPCRDRPHRQPVPRSALRRGGLCRTASQLDPTTDTVRTCSPGTCFSPQIGCRLR